MSGRPSRSNALKKKQRNKKWKRHPRDWYVEPVWCSERLFQAEKFKGRVWDPAAGLGRIMDAAARAGLEVVGSDIVVRQPDAYQACNFLKCPVEGIEPNIVCNPPFKHAEAFVRHALELSERKVAMLLPASWVQGAKRSQWLERTPLRRVYFLAPRPPMPPGPVVVKAKGPIGGGLVDFAWFVWEHGYEGVPEIRWLRRDDGITSAHMGPDEKQRHRIKHAGRLKPANGLPLFGRSVTRDGKQESA